MKNSQIVAMIVAFLVGAALVIGFGQLNKEDDSELRAELAAAQAEIDKLKSRVGIKVEAPKLTSLPSALPDKVEVVATDVIEEEEEETPDFATAMSNFANSEQGRNLMKMGIARMKQGTDVMVQQGISRYAEQLNLSEGQIATLKTRLTAHMNEQMEEFEAEIGNENVNMREIMEKRGEMRVAQEEAMMEIVKEELTEDQFADLERQQLVEKTERVQKDSDRELSRLDRDLELTQSQEDQVFGILVQTNSDYDDSMAIEGAEGVQPVGEDVAKDDAIRAVLDEEQQAKYNTSLEQRQNRRRNPFGGGGFGGFGR